jgi:Ca2+-binding RTX toxin-like protein
MALITGNNNSNFLIGTNSDDWILGYGGSDDIEGNDGNDLIYGGTGGDIINGDSGNDLIFGNDGNDFLFGNVGDDLINGGLGNDQINGFGGGQEYDTLTGGGGVNEFILGNFSQRYYSGSGYATITDFNWIFDTLIVPANINIDDYTIDTANLSGGTAVDTRIRYGSDWIAVLEDVNLTNINPSSYLEQALAPVP